MGKWGVAFYCFHSACSDHLRDQKTKKEQTHWSREQAKKRTIFFLGLQTTEGRWVEFLYSAFLVLVIFSWLVPPTSWGKQTVSWSTWSPDDLSDPRVSLSIFQSFNLESRLFSQAAEVKEYIVVALTLLISLVQSSILYFISKPVPGSNTHNLSYRASGADMFCHFRAIKVVKGSLSVSCRAQRVPNWIAVKWEPPKTWLRKSFPFYTEPEDSKHASLAPLWASVYHGVPWSLTLGPAVTCIGWHR